MFRRLLATLVAVLFVLAGSAPLTGSQAAPAQRPAPKSQPPAKKARKVWTNEDVEALRTSGTGASEAPTAASAASSASGEASAAGESADKAGAQQKEENPVEKLRKRLTPIRTELDSVEAQLRALRQTSSSGKTSGGVVDVSKSPGGLNTENQVTQLEQRRAELLRQIADIEDEARRAGISPGSIR